MPSSSAPTMSEGSWEGGSARTAGWVGAGGAFFLRVNAVIQHFYLLRAHRKAVYRQIVNDRVQGRLVLNPGANPKAVVPHFLDAEYQHPLKP